MSTFREHSHSPAPVLTKTSASQPLNNGAWTYVQPRLITALKQTQHHKGKVPEYAGRNPTSSVATGSKTAHKAEIASLLNMALGN